MQNNAPTEAQYKALNELINSIRAEYWKLPIYWHWQLEWEATACPGKMFDYSRIEWGIWAEAPKEVAIEVKKKIVIPKTEFTANYPTDDSYIW